MPGPAQPFSSERLLNVLQQFPQTQRYWVGFSGGADSAALLLAMSELAPRLEASIHAVHVNHGLHADADDWQARCEKTCTMLGIPVSLARYQSTQRAAGNLEANARHFRYSFAESIMDDGDIFLTAHNLHDQAETLLLNLARGSGINGLAGMPGIRPLGNGLLARPLLDTAPGVLRDYLRERDMDWIEDPSNEDRSFDRNFLRHELLPLMEARWNGIHERLVRSAGHSREAAFLLDGLADEKLASGLDTDFVLSLRRPATIDRAELKLVIRRWVRKAGAPPLPGARLTAILDQVAVQSPENSTCVQWCGWRLRSYRNRIWLEEPDVHWACPTHDWSGSEAITISSATGTLELQGALNALPVTLQVRCRVGGERMRIAGRAHSRRVKQLFRERRIPPWMRSAVPLLMHSDEVVAVADWHVSDQMETWLQQIQAKLCWRPANRALAYAAGSDCGSPVDPTGSLR